MVLGVSYLRVLAQRPTGCCSASYYYYQIEYWTRTIIGGFHDSGSLRALMEVSRLTTIFSFLYYYVMLLLYATEDVGVE